MIYSGCCGGHSNMKQTLWDAHAPPRLLKVGAIIHVTHDERLQDISLVIGNIVSDSSSGDEISRYEKTKPRSFIPRWFWQIQFMHNILYSDGSQIWVNVLMMAMASRQPETITSNRYYHNLPYPLVWSSLATVLTGRTFASRCGRQDLNNVLAVVVQERAHASSSITTTNHQFHIITRVCCTIYHTISSGYKPWPSCMKTPYKYIVCVGFLLL